jgi:hypothetical protein
MKAPMKIRWENLAVRGSQEYVCAERMFFRLKEQLEHVQTLSELGRIEAQREEFFGTIRKESPASYCYFKLPDVVLQIKIGEKMSEFQDKIVLN